MVGVIVLLITTLSVMHYVILRNLALASEVQEDYRPNTYHSE